MAPVCGDGAIGDGVGDIVPGMVDLMVGTAVTGLVGNRIMDMAADPLDFLAVALGVIVAAV